MIRSSAPPKIDGVALCELYVSLLPQNAQVTGKFVLVRRGEGGFLGPISKTDGWSEETRKKLDELLSSIELDLSSEIFETSSSEVRALVEDPKQL